MAKIPILQKDRIISIDHQPLFDDVRFGVLVLVNKPYGWTSFDVVNKIRSSLKYGPKIKKIKVGHAGTLDPLAEGLLLVCIGKYTKLIDGLTGKNKSYLASIKLGAVTKTYDRESEEENTQDTSHISRAALEKCLLSFKGIIEQYPPIYSAIKVNGVSAHRLARKGKDVVLKSRKVEISKLDLLKYELPFIETLITCSKGTYIRSLAHDVGQHLGVGAYLYNLNRTSVGTYRSAQALSVDEVIRWINQLPEHQLLLGDH